MMRSKNDACILAIFVIFVTEGKLMHQSLVDYTTAECSADESGIWLENWLDVCTIIGCVQI